jgi:hypothetical protein
MIYTEEHRPKLESQLNEEDAKKAIKYPEKTNLYTFLYDYSNGKYGGNALKFVYIFSKSGKPTSSSEFEFLKCNESDEIKEIVGTPASPP